MWPSKIIFKLESIKSVVWILAVSGCFHLKVYKMDEVKKFPRRNYFQLHDSPDVGRKQRKSRCRNCYYIRHKT